MTTPEDFKPVPKQTATTVIESLVVKETSTHTIELDLMSDGSVKWRKVK